MRELIGLVYGGLQVKVDYQHLLTWVKFQRSIELCRCEKRSITRAHGVRGIKIPLTPCPCYLQETGKATSKITNDAIYVILSISACEVIRMISVFFCFACKYVPALRPPKFSGHFPFPRDSCAKQAFVLRCDMFVNVKTLFRSCKADEFSCQAFLLCCREKKVSLRSRCKSDN